MQTNNKIESPLAEIVVSNFDNVVALEPYDVSSAELFFRENDKITTQKIAFAPFFLITTPDFLTKFNYKYEITELNGDETFKFLVSFPDISTYNKALKHLKDNTGLTASNPNAPYRVFSDLQQQIMIQSEFRLFRNMKFSEIRRLQLDIETLTTHGYNFPNPSRPDDKIIVICMCDNTGWEKCLVLDDNNSEKKLLEDFVKIIIERDPDVIEGHNILRFDLPFIEERARRHNVKLTLGRNLSIPQTRTSIFTAAERSISYKRYDIYGRHIIDTYLLVQLYDISHRDLESYGLKSVAKHFGVASKDRTYIDASNIEQYFTKEKNKLIAYAMDDVRETRAISSILSPSYFYQTQLEPYSYQNSVVRGNATKIDALLIATYLTEKHSIPVPSQSKQFSGGLTESFDSGVFSNVWHCDIRSLYPSIILAYNLFPHRDKLKKFPYFLTKLRQFRLDAKDKEKNAKTQEDKEYFNSLQTTFKIIINSFYGYLAFSQGTFNDSSVAEKVASKGREILQSMIDFLSEIKAKIIEVDTDGIYFQPPENIKTTAEIQKLVQDILPKGIDVELDATYPTMFSYKSKNYAVLTSSGEIGITGAALKSRGVEPFIRNYIKEFMILLLNNKHEKIANLFDTYRKNIETQSIPLEQLAKTETLNDPLDKYKAKIASGTGKRSAVYELAIKSERTYRQGDQISYYIIGTKKNLSVVDNCKLLTEAGKIRDENTAYYLEKLEDIHKKFIPFAKIN